VRQLPACLADGAVVCVVLAAIRYFQPHGVAVVDSAVLQAPASEDEQTLLIDTLQDWKTDKYQQMIG